MVELSRRKTISLGGTGFLTAILIGGGARAAGPTR